MSEIIKRPAIKSVDFCVDENIWGHRLYDEQLPHLTVLEFLGVLGSNLDKPLRPHEGLGGAVQFKPQRQMRLRGLLFNNPYVESIAESKLRDGGAARRHRVWRISPNTPRGGYVDSGAPPTPKPAPVQPGESGWNSSSFDLLNGLDIVQIERLSVAQMPAPPAQTPPAPD